MNKWHGATPWPWKWRSWSGSSAMYKVNDLEFQGHVIEIKILIITIGFVDPETIPMKNFTKIFGRKDQNPEGVAKTPLVANFSWNSLVVRGLIFTNSVFLHIKHFKFNNLYIFIIVSLFHLTLCLQDHLIHWFCPSHMSEHLWVKGHFLSLLQDSGIASHQTPVTR